MATDQLVIGDSFCSYDLDVLLELSDRSDSVFLFCILLNEHGKWFDEKYFCSNQKEQSHLAPELVQFTESTTTFSLRLQYCAMSGVHEIHFWMYTDVNRTSPIKEQNKIRAILEAKDTSIPIQYSFHNAPPEAIGAQLCRFILRDEQWYLILSKEMSSLPIETLIQNQYGGVRKGGGLSPNPLHQKGSVVILPSISKSQTSHIVSQPSSTAETSKTNEKRIYMKPGESFDILGSLSLDVVFNYSQKENVELLLFAILLNDREEWFDDDHVCFKEQTNKVHHMIEFIPAQDRFHLDLEECLKNGVYGVDFWVYTSKGESVIDKIAKAEILVSDTTNTKYLKHKFYNKEADILGVQVGQFRFIDQTWTLLSRDEESRCTIMKLLQEKYQGQRNQNGVSAFKEYTAGPIIDVQKQKQAPPKNKTKKTNPAQASLTDIDPRVITLHLPEYQVESIQQGEEILKKNKGYGEIGGKNRYVLDEHKYFPPYIISLQKKY